ncbi:hypothetical protein [Streptomyces sp. NPDC060035]|uniref:hypothetical protein n=1 Tax=Streptomyces sp. NPDC060035 TaxID=3347044 RepID=UPI0036A9E31C
MSDRIRRTSLAFLAVAALTAGTSACVDSRTAAPPPPVQVAAADLHGTWKGWGNSSVELRADGVAAVRDLDGQEFRFDEGWRMTGSGTWSLSAPGRNKGGNTVGAGFVVRLTVELPGQREEGKGSVDPSQSASPSRLPTAAARTAAPPAKASWDMGVVKDKGGRLALFFLTSDPDVRDTYYLSKS